MLAIVKYTDVTEQLKSEIRSKERFKLWCDGKFEIIREYESSENKKEGTNADFVIKPTKSDYGISIKTEGGAFTTGNLGAGIGGAKKWTNNPHILDLIKQASKQVANIRNSYSETRWDELDNMEHHKYVVMKPFIDVYLFIFSEESNVLNYCKYLSSRNADFLWKEGALYRMPPIIPTSTTVTLRNKTITIPGAANLRFKSSGGKIKDSIKINFEKCK